MPTFHPAPLLVAALVMLHHPCSRNKATARLLLERAAEHAGLTPAEREACRNLADDLEVERPESVVTRTPLKRGIAESTGWRMPAESLEPR